MRPWDLLPVTRDAAGGGVRPPDRRSLAGPPACAATTAARTARSCRSSRAGRCCARATPGSSPPSRATSASATPRTRRCARARSASAAWSSSPRTSTGRPTPSTAWCTPRATRNTGRWTISVIGRARWDRPSIRPDAAGWAAHRATLDARLPFHDFEIERIDADGVRRYRALSGEPIFGPGGKFLGYRGVGRDTTERRREERLVALEHCRVARAHRRLERFGRGPRRDPRRCASPRAGRWGATSSSTTRRACCASAKPGAPTTPAVQKFIERSRDMVYRRGEGLSGCVWRDGKPLSVGRHAATTRARSARRPFARGPSLGGGAFVFPVIFEGKTIGVLSFSSAQTREADERLLKTIHVVGSQVGQFMQRKQAEARSRRASSASARPSSSPPPASPTWRSTAASSASTGACAKCSATPRPSWSAARSRTSRTPTTATSPTPSASACAAASWPSARFESATSARTARCCGWR